MTNPARPKGGVKGPQRAADAIEVAGRVGPLGELGLVVLAAYLAVRVDEYRGVVDVVPDSLGETEAEAHAKLFSQPLEPLDVRAVDGLGHCEHVLGGAAALQHLHHAIAVKHALGGKDKLGGLAGGLPEVPLQLVGVVVLVPLLRL